MQRHSRYSQLTSKAPVYIGSLQSAEDINQDILQQYEAVKNTPNIKKTHHFMGRFENTYIPENQIPAIRTILDMGLFYATEILQIPPAELRRGFWFNEMHQGHKTTLHTHEEEDELLSAVYYIQAAENAGDLIVRNGTDSVHLQPVAGRMILFRPEVPHEVETNNTDVLRLSVAINFGRKNPENQ